MMQFLIAAPSSGSGKTTVACAVLAALKKRGADPCAFKSGPDYIDPMFHRSALQVDSHKKAIALSGTCCAYQSCTFHQMIGGKLHIRESGRSCISNSNPRNLNKRIVVCRRLLQTTCT